MMGRVGEKVARIWFALCHARKFASIGRRSHIVSPFRLDGASRIVIGADTLVQRGGWLYCVGVDGIEPALTIGDGCVFGYNSHITAVRDVRIGDHVLTANNVYISDNVHSYEDTRVPIMHQPVLFRRAVSIGAGSWIGENACVIGASVGRNCVVSANAVVTRDAPDWCVVAGVPARVIRQFDPIARRWVTGPLS